MSKLHERDLVLLGQAVSRLREQRGMSTNELADATGIERLRISILEAGKLDPTYELLIALAEGRGVQPSALVIRAEKR
jgi:transcriptional regulator with XRE-family HTH domain